MVIPMTPKWFILEFLKFEVHSERTTTSNLCFNHLPIFLLAKRGFCYLSSWKVLPFLSYLESASELESSSVIPNTQTLSKFVDASVLSVLVFGLLVLPHNGCTIQCFIVFLWSYSIAFLPDFSSTAYSWYSHQT